MDNDCQGLLGIKWMDHNYWIGWTEQGWIMNARGWTEQGWIMNA
jgi:hypothetical protein